MKAYLLDTSALLTLRDDESGADSVADLLAQSQQSKIKCFGCFMTLMEVLCRVWRDESEVAGHLAYEQCLSLPIVWQHETPALLVRAAQVKARYPLSLADAWMQTVRWRLGPFLYTKTPNFRHLPSIKMSCRSRRKKLSAMTEKLDPCSMRATVSAVPNIDVSPEHWEIVRGILQKHLPQHEVWAFGSRSKWTAKPYSDLDLAVITSQPLPLKTSADLSDDFSVSDLPWKADVVGWATTRESFRKIIAHDKLVVQRAELTSHGAQLD